MRNGHFVATLKNLHLYGFAFGAANITRMAHVEGRYHVLAVDTPHRHVQIGVSPTGRSVRVWVDGRELK